MINITGDVGRRLYGRRGHARRGAGSSEYGEGSSRGIRPLAKMYARSADEGKALKSSYKKIEAEVKKEGSGSARACAQSVRKETHPGDPVLLRGRNNRYL